MSKETGNNDFASFDEYLRQGEPTQKESAENWKTAIGLQAVDGLHPSTYLIDVARKNIEGKISLDETKNSSTLTIRAKPLVHQRTKRRKKLIKFQPISPRFSPAKLLHSIPMDTFPFIDAYSKEC